MADEPVVEPTVEPVVEPQVQPPESIAGPSEYDTLMAQKGFKSNEDVAKSYREAESTLHRTQNLHSNVKQQLEAHGYTLDDKGTIIQGQQPQADPYAQPQGQQTGQPQQDPYAQPQADPIYDPYTGQQITNPVDAQLAAMPISQRMTFAYNALADQREQQNRDAFGAEQEVLNDPSAKGFESDVKKVMMQVPLAQRMKKESWQDALLKVKGMKYDDALKGAGAQGVESFLNKEGVQTIPSGVGSGEGTIRLTQEQETGYQWYAENHPGMFKDRTHFAKRLQNTG